MTQMECDIAIDSNVPESPVSVDQYFWKRAFLLNPLIGDYFGPWDTEIFSSLEDFGIEWNDDRKNYRLWMEFKRNRFFSSRIVWKEFESTLRSTKCSGINWRTGYSPLEIITAREEYSSKVTMCRRRGVNQTLFVYFMYGIDDESEVILTSILISIWKNPFRMGY